LHKKLLITIACCSLFSVTGTSQSTVPDSLENIISLAASNNQKIDATFKLADYYAVSDKSKSFRILEQSLAWTRKIGNKKLEARCLNKLGDFYWYSGDYPLASRHYYTALYLFEELHEQKEIAVSYRNIGWIYLGQKNYAQSGYYFRKALDQMKKYGKQQDLIPCYDDLGILYRTTGNYAKAISCFQQTIKLGRKFGNQKAVAGGTSDLATTYLKMGRYETARTFYLEAIALHEQISDQYNLCTAYIGLGECYIALKDSDQAMSYLLKANKMSADNHYKNPEIESLKHLGRAAMLAQKPTVAYDYMYRYASLSDSMHDDNQNRQMHEMSAKYESDKQDADIRYLQKQEQFMNERLNKEIKFKTYMLIFSGIVLILTFSFFRSYRDNKKANRHLSRAYAEIESKNKDISDSINYARQIQRARLPDHDLINRLFRESFGLFKPKDIVSGDFYWFAELKNGKTAFAAADCTGHGIPGAFMSLIGIDTLHQAMIENELANPAEILSFSNVSLKKALRQNDEFSASRDGMDIALCILDREKMELCYAGAHRPLIIIRNDEITEIKATKHAIGGLTPDNQQFDMHTLPVESNDMIYVFTDGYADQFGGHCDKKYTTRKFKELLLSIYTRPAKEQEKMLDIVFEAWRGTTEQVDDVLVMGIRV